MEKQKVPKIWNSNLLETQLRNFASYKHILDKIGNKNNGLNSIDFFKNYNYNYYLEEKINEKNKSNSGSRTSVFRNSHRSNNRTTYSLQKSQMTPLKFFNLQIPPLQKNSNSLSKTKHKLKKKINILRIKKKFNNQLLQKTLRRSSSASIRRSNANIIKLLTSQPPLSKKYKILLNNFSLNKKGKSYLKNLNNNELDNIFTQKIKISFSEVINLINYKNNNYNDFLFDMRKSLDEEKMRKNKFESFDEDTNSIFNKNIKFEVFNNIIPMININTYGYKKNDKKKKNIHIVKNYRNTLSNSLYKRPMTHSDYLIRNSLGNFTNYTSDREKYEKSNNNNKIKYSNEEDLNCENNNNSNKDLNKNFYKDINKSTINNNNNNNTNIITNNKNNGENSCNNKNDMSNKDKMLINLQSIRDYMNNRKDLGNNRYGNIISFLIKKQNKKNEKFTFNLKQKSLEKRDLFKENINLNRLKKRKKKSQDN